MYAKKEEESKSYKRGKWAGTDQQRKEKETKQETPERRKKVANNLKKTEEEIERAAEGIRQKIGIDWAGVTELIPSWKLSQISWKNTRYVQIWQLLDWSLTTNTSCG